MPRGNPEYCEYEYRSPDNDTASFQFGFSFLSLLYSLMAESLFSPMEEPARLGGAGIMRESSDIVELTVIRDMSLSPNNIVMSGSWKAHSFSQTNICTYNCESITVPGKVEIFSELYQKLCWYSPLQNINLHNRNVYSGWQLAISHQNNQSSTLHIKISISK